jgi:hypothetical protein
MWLQCCWINIPDPNCFPSRIPDQDFFHPGSRIRIKEFKYFNPKNFFQDLRNMIQVFIPDPDLTFYLSRIPDPEVKKAPDPGSATLVTPDYLLINWIRIPAQF